MKIKAAEPGKVPAEVRRYLEAKGLKPSWDWDDVWQEEHAEAFTAAKAMGQDVLAALREAVDAAIEGGLPFAEFACRTVSQLEIFRWASGGGVREARRPRCLAPGA